MTKDQEEMVHALFECGWSTKDIAEIMNLDEMEVQDYFEDNF